MRRKKISKEKFDRLKEKQEEEEEEEKEYSEILFQMFCKFENLGKYRRRKEKIRELLGKKSIYGSWKVYPKVKFKSYVFRKGRMKFRR